jgi:hypothetical protein
MLWIIDLKGNFIFSTPLSPDQQSILSSICVSHQKIYICGQKITDSESVAQLWITDTNGVVLKQKPLASPEVYSATSKLIAVEDRVFIAGIYEDKPYLWVLDLEGNILNQTYLTHSYEGQAVDLYPCKDTLALCGHVLKETTTASCWIVNRCGDLVRTIELESQKNSKAYSLTALGNTVCISGYEQINGQSITTLWLVDTKRFSQKTVNLGSGFYKEDSSTQITAQRNLLFLSGNISRNSTTKAWLYLLDPYGNLLNSTCLAENASYSLPKSISSRDSGLLIKAQRAFSPIVEQKGLRK